MSLPSANDALTPSEALVARFRADLTPLFAVERDALLIAVSGGPDSLALLLLAHAVLGDRCVAATVDHRLRAASADEAAFVSELCGRRGIAHATLRGELPARVGRSTNLSTRARALRYTLLTGERDRVGAAAIATAHHADDQVETLAMRLNRGAGLAGLAGVRAAGEAIRPLLGWERAELAAVVQGCGIRAVQDSSNTDDRFDRARLRKALAGADWIDAAGWGASAKALADAEAALAWSADQIAQDRCQFGEDWAMFVPRDIPFELCRRLVERCLRHVDATIESRGPELVRMIAALHDGRPATLGRVRAHATTAGFAETYWHFAPAPPHRSQ